MSNERPRLRAGDFGPEVLLVFDQYVHGDIDRRTFLERVGRIAVGAMSAVTLLGALNPRFAEARQVGPGDERLDARYVEYDSPRGHGCGRGYLVRPARAQGPLPVVLVIHENRGRNPHIEDVVRRVALEGFVALALATTLAGLAAAVRYTAHVYPDTQHGFHDDTTPRYDEDGAKLAWRRTIFFSSEHCVQSGLQTRGRRSTHDHEHPGRHERARGRRRHFPHQYARPLA